LMSVFGVTVFAEFGALAASAGERDHELSLSVRMWTLPKYAKFNPQNQPLSFIKIRASVRSEHPKRFDPSILE
jgi:hypothetical protein